MGFNSGYMRYHLNVLLNITSLHYKNKSYGFQGKCPVRSKIFLNNKSIIEQVSSFNYLGCNVTYKYDEDLNDKFRKFKNQETTDLKFYKIMVVLVLL
jgi:hypothetical protein